MMKTMVAEGTAGGALLRRVVLLLAAAVVVASMVAATASPALAIRQRNESGNFLCTPPSGGEAVPVNGAGRNTLEDQGFVCVQQNKIRV